MNRMVAATVILCLAHAPATAGLPVQEQAAADFARLIKAHCTECHGTDRAEAEIDLSGFRNRRDIARDPAVWSRVLEMLTTEQMPPPEAKQLVASDRGRLTRWVREELLREARKRSGDPGPVILRRLSNAEYTFAIRDLTGVAELDPAREFPVDGAAGEGFTNAGAGLVMSPSLFRKYLDAARGVSQHAVLLPDGIRFSRHTTSRDLTDAKLSELREFYARYTESGGGITVNLTGRPFTTNRGGLLPLARYLAASIEERDRLRSGGISIDQVATACGLSTKYLRRLWEALSAEPASPFLEPIRTAWRNSEAADVPQLIELIDQWRARLWRFNIVGHIGREGAPQSWMEPVIPIIEQLPVRVPLEPVEARDVLVRLHVGSAGDGSEADFVQWEELQLQGPRDAIPLAGVESLTARLGDYREDLARRLSAYLAAARGQGSVESRAAAHDVHPEVLGPFLQYLEIDTGGAVQVTGHYKQRMLDAGGYEPVDGWGSGETPSIVANSSDQEYRIPGRVRPHGLAMHPSPTLFTAIGWQSPIDGVVTVDAHISDAHPNCGNGAQWWVRHESATRRLMLETGVFGLNGSGRVAEREVRVRKGELISLLVGPRDGNHFCDLTEVNLTIRELSGERREWNAAADLSDNITQSNPHPDQFGNKTTWHLYTGPVADAATGVKSVPQVPAGSLLAQWRDARSAEHRAKLQRQFVALMEDPQPGEPTDEADAEVLSHLRSLPVVLSPQLLRGLENDKRFGVHPRGQEGPPQSLIVRAPDVVEFRIPAELARGRTLTGRAVPEPTHGLEGTTRVQVVINDQVPVAVGEILCHDGSTAQKRLRQQLTELGELFPIALCYTRIVPVDEVVTATLFHREDELLQKLMLEPREIDKLNRLWDELLWVSEEPLKMVVSLEQIREFSTQDRQELVAPWDRMRPAVLARAERFRQRQLGAQPRQLESVVSFAARAWRRPLDDQESGALRELYQTLRDDGLDHSRAVRLLLARILTSPEFLYRRESPGDGDRWGPVSPHELAARLSFFLTSSVPDEFLRESADQGTLVSDNELLRQTKRLLNGPGARRMAIQFGCQWLHIRDFDESVEKNESLYPEFPEVRAAISEEPVRFFEDLIRRDRSILRILSADDLFVNGELAELYGVEQRRVREGWWSVPGTAAGGRGGVLGMAAVLASQSGASRSSPILRGTWVSETLLGERLPRPPANVPVLPETVPAGLTARELIEQHSAVPECARCHKRIDPYGFALEAFDTIGRRRKTDVGTDSVLPDGTRIAGLSGLREYLVNQRRDDFVRQFCRKLLGYALGREVLLSDEDLISAMMLRLRQNDYRFHAAVETIVLSDQFRMVRGSQFRETP